MTDNRISDTVTAWLDRNLPFTFSEMVASLFIPGVGAAAITYAIFEVGRSYKRREVEALYNAQKERADTLEATLYAVHSPHRDAWLYDAVFYRLFGSWRNDEERILPPPGLSQGDVPAWRKAASEKEIWRKATEALQLLRQSAIEERIVVWGCSKEYSSVPGDWMMRMTLSRKSHQPTG